MMVELNEQQAKAASHSKGPLLVIAGPGSGKTRVIIEKILHLVKSNVEQSSILCLTFTEKAAGEMKQRLEKHGIIDAKINTFHAFSKEILEENFMESGLGRDTKILKKSSQMVWCIRNTDKFNFNSDYVELGHNQVRIYSAMLEGISNFKEEMISPDAVQDHINENLKALESRDPDDDDVKEQSKFFNKLKEFNKVYYAYQQYLKEKHLIDFDDMITKTVELLQKDPVILSNYQKKFQHILVDEFQDNNFSQLEIVKMLAKHGNITAVGDDDQCIMKFQGAYSGIFDDFKSSYTCETVELSQNYRSNQNIVKLANQLLDPISNRVKKSLFSSHEEGEPISVIRTATDNGEVEFAVNTIQKIIGKPLKRRDGTTKPIAYSDITILSRRKTEGQKFAKTLKSFGIPATFTGESNIFASPGILDLISFLKITSSPLSSGAEVYRLLKSQGIAEKNIAVITHAAHKKARYVYDGQDDYVLETLRKFDGFDITQKEEIRELIEQIDSIVSFSSTATISQLVYKIMMSYSDIYKKSIYSEKTQDKKNIILLNKFYEITQEFQDIYPEEPLSEFLTHVSILGEFEIEIEDVLFEDAVNVQTLHKSKGKEFPIVFITDLAENRFPVSYKERTFHVPQKLMRGVDRTLETSQLHLEEERRLFYVGMTRAMNMLFLLYPKKYPGNVNEKEPSQFLTELDYENNPLIKLVDFKESESMNMQAEEVIDRVKADLQKEAASAVNQLNLKTAIHRIVELARIKHFEKHGNFDNFDSQEVLKINMEDVNLTEELTGGKSPLIDKESFTLSPSSITAYSDCPLKFKFQKVLRVPSPSSVALDLGSVVHAITEEVAQEKMKGEEVVEKKAISKIKDKWIFNSYQSQSEENTAMERAEQMVQTYVKWEKETKNELVGLEVPFDVKIGDITFTGRIDRLEKNPDGKYEVVDFKSGKTVKSKNKAKIDPQLNIYAKAVEKLKGELPVKASLFYVEKDKMVVYPVTEESVNETMDTIIGMTKEILSENFEATPSYNACMFCSYQSICDAKVTEE